MSADANGSRPEGANTGTPSPHGVKDDRFHMIALICQRARQLQQGARPRVYKDGHKPTRLAQLEVLAGLVSWEVVPDPAQDKA
jgi:DNA-directed RNA polymerase subunit K/omega